MKVNFNRAKAHSFLSKMFCLVVIASAIFAFASCDSKHPSALVGKWERTGGSGYDSRDGVQEFFIGPDKIEFLKDGKALFQDYGWTINYSAKYDYKLGDIHTTTWEVSDNRLFMRHYNDDETVPVCIDTKGNAKFTLSQAKKVYPFYKGYARFSITADAYSPDSIVDKSGRVVPVPKGDEREDYIERFGEGLYPFYDREINKYGYRNKKGETVINLQFDDASIFSEGLAAVRIGNYTTRKVGFIDKKGKIVINPQFDGAGFFLWGQAIVGVGDVESLKYGVIDQTGKFVISPQFKRDDIMRFSEGLYLFKEYEGAEDYEGKYGLIDRKGNIVLTPQISEIDNIRKYGSGYQTDWSKKLKWKDFFYEPDWHDGLVAVRIGDYNRDPYGTPVSSQWGFMDQTGKYVINPQFSDCEFINNELIAVCVGGKRTGVGNNITGKWGVIDRTGKYVINPQLQGEIKHWCIGFPFILSDKVIISTGYGETGVEYGIMDIQNKTVVNNLKFDDINFNHGGSAVGFHIPNDFRLGDGYTDEGYIGSMFSQRFCQ